MDSVKEDRRKRLIESVEENRDRLLNFLQKMIEFDTTNPPGNERKMQEWLADWLKKYGYDVDIWNVVDHRPDVVGVLKSRNQNGNSLILNGHADTVAVPNPQEWRYAPFKGEVEEGRIYGRGACDMKGGIACMIMALEAVREAGYELGGDIIVESVVGEESSEPGTLATVKRGYRADAALIAEPTSLNVVPVVGGSILMKLKVSGLSTHTCHRWSGIHAGGTGDSVNAIEKGVKILNALFELEREWAVKKKHPLFPAGWTTISPNVIHTSPWPITIPDEFVVDYAIYYLPTETGESVRREIEEYVDHVASCDGWMRNHRPVLDWIVDYEPAETDIDHGLVKALTDAEKSVLTREPDICAFESVCDMKYLRNNGNIDTVIFGPGSLKQAHCVDEYVSIDELIDAAKIMALTILDWCNSK